MAATRAIVERERTAVERRWSGELQQAERIVDDACGTAYQALEALLLRHAPPQSAIAWRLVADADGYDAQVRLGTRFGLEAQFGVALPEGHPWSKLRRAADLAAGQALRVPKTLRLDKLFVSEAVVEPERVSLWLRRSPRTGAGVRITVAGETEEAEVQLLDELGQPQGDVYELDDDDRARAVPPGLGAGRLDLRSGAAPPAHDRRRARRQHAARPLRAARRGRAPGRRLRADRRGDLAPLVRAQRAHAAPRRRRRPARGRCSSPAPSCAAGSPACPRRCARSSIPSSCKPRHACAHVGFSRSAGAS